MVMNAKMGFRRSAAIGLLCASGFLTAACGSDDSANPSGVVNEIQQETDDAVDGAGDAANDAKDKAEDAAGDAKDAADDAKDKAGEEMGDAGHEMSDMGDDIKDGSGNAPG